MSIELDWQIVEEDTPPPDEEPGLPPAGRPRPRVPGKWVLGLALILFLLIGAIAAYSARMYRMRLAQAAEQAGWIAQLEAQAAAADDRASFMALQDPDDSAWRALQEKRFGQTDRSSLPQFGWRVTNEPPRLGVSS